MLVLLTPPVIGTAVTSGAFATKDLETPKRTGFDWAKKGVRPVAVGPCASSPLMADFFLGTFNTGHIFLASFGSTVVLGCSTELLFCQDKLL